MKLSAPEKQHFQWRYAVLLLVAFGILVVAQNVSARDHDRRAENVERKLKQSHQRATYKKAETKTIRHQHRRDSRHERRAHRGEARSYRYSHYRASHTHYRHKDKHRYKRFKRHHRVYRDDYLAWRYPVSYRWIEYEYYQPRIVFLREHPRFGAVYFNEALGYCYGGWNRCIPVEHRHSRRCPKWHRHVYDFAWYDYGPEVVIRSPNFSIRFDWM